MSLATRLKQLREDKCLNQGAFALSVGIKQGSLSDIERGKAYPSVDLLIKIKSIYRVNLDWLISGNGSMYYTDNVCVDIGTNVRCPILAEIAAGPPVEARDVEPIDYISLDSTLLPANGSVYCFRVNGRSMEPLIQHGDIVVVTSVYDPLSIDHTIMAFRDPDGITLKQIIIDDRSKVTLLLPINHEYKPLVYNEESDLTIIGKLILSIRKY